MSTQEKISQNIIKILNERNLKQVFISQNSDYSAAQVSKILTGRQSMTVDDLSKFAKVLSVREIDLLTYPDRYFIRDDGDKEPVEAVLQIKLKKDKKDQVLKLVFGENNIEILNK